MHILLAIFGLVFLQQENPCENGIHWELVQGSTLAITGILSLGKKIHLGSAL